jgi:hypothetical protein
MTDPRVRNRVTLSLWPPGGALVQDFPLHGQDGLHAAASELWLFGLATAHVVTKASAFGRLGALAGGPWTRHPGAPMHRVYGIGTGYRTCRSASV